MLSEPPRTGPDGTLQLHASTVVIDGRAVAFTGPAGSGKTAMAFAMMARGARLLADDVTWVRKVDEGLMALCPDTLIGRIEARGIGILNAPAAPPSPLSLIVDLGRAEEDRIPPRRHLRLMGQTVDLLHIPAMPHFADMIWHYITFGPVE